jgi:hypothetical protein
LRQKGLYWSLYQRQQANIWYWVDLLQSTVEWIWNRTL